MNLDDETNLSAYLDEELDPADRLAVEWAVESSPPLAEQLRSLALARDAVAGLDRPTIPRDLGPILRARIASDRRRARIRSFAGPVRVAFAGSAFATIAASLIFAMIFLFRSLHPTDAPLVAIHDQIQPKPAPAPRSHPIEPSVPSPAPTELVLNRDLPASTFETHPSDLAPPDEFSELKTRQQMTRILERPPVHRIVIVTDVIDDASKKVLGLIANDARKDPMFGRISICENIVIDPEWSEPAEVFAVPMDEGGRRSFVTQLSRIFPKLIEDGESNPGLVTQLTEIGRVSVFRGTEASPLVSPPDELKSFIANRTTTKDNPLVELEPNPFDLGRPGGFLPALKPQPDDASHPKSAVLASKSFGDRPGDVGPPASYRLPPVKPSDPVTLLVWITRPVKRSRLSL